jgi:hypothetical protein
MRSARISNIALYAYEGCSRGKCKTRPNASSDRYDWRRVNIRRPAKLDLIMPIPAFSRASITPTLNFQTVGQFGINVIQKT